MALSCWLFHKTFKNGYGRVGNRYAHRISYEAFVGPIPDGLFVCHKCDVKNCVNPSHLFIGTAKDNMIDCARKGRNFVPLRARRSDEKHPQAKLTNAQVKVMRKMKTKTCAELGRIFGVDPKTAWKARTGRSFRDLKNA
jgi:hypothetical protein